MNCIDLLKRRSEVFGTAFIETKTLYIFVRYRGRVGEYDWKKWTAPMGENTSTRKSSEAACRRSLKEYGLLTDEHEINALKDGLDL